MLHVSVEADGWANDIALGEAVRWLHARRAHVSAALHGYAVMPAVNESKWRRVTFARESVAVHLTAVSA